MVPETRRQYGGEQCIGIRVFSMLEKNAGPDRLHDPSQIEHHDRGGHFFYQGKVVADQKIGQVELLFQIQEQIRHLLFDMGVQGIQGFIQEENPGVLDQGPGNAGPLTLATGNMGGQAAEHPIIQVQPLDQRLGYFFSLAGRNPAGPKWFLNGPLQGVIGRKRGPGILKDHLSLPAQGEMAFPVIPGQGCVFQKDPAFIGMKPEQGFGDGGFSGSAFSDQAEHVVGIDLQADPFYGGQIAGF